MSASRTARLRARLDRLERALAVDQPWPVADVLDKLSNAAEHLLTVHGCDTHGYEEIGGCVQRARQYATAIRGGKR